jgi:hypothetical protein
MERAFPTDPRLRPSLRTRRIGDPHLAFGKLLSRSVLPSSLSTSGRPLQVALCRPISSIPISPSPSQFKTKGCRTQFRTSNIITLFDRSYYHHRRSLPPSRPHIAPPHLQHCRIEEILRASIFGPPNIPYSTSCDADSPSRAIKPRAQKQPRFLQ